MQGPEVLGQPRRQFNAGHLLVDVGALLSPAARKNKRAAGPGVRLQEFPGRMVQGYFLVLAALGLADMDKPPVREISPRADEARAGVSFSRKMPLPAL